MVDHCLRRFGVDEFELPDAPRFALLLRSWRGKAAQHAKWRAGVKEALEMDFLATLADQHILWSRAMTYSGWDGTVEAITLVLQ